MPQVGDEIRSPNGATLRMLEVSDDLLAMDATWPETGNLPPAHLHPGQAERFEVLEGGLQTVIDGAERTYGAGEVFEVPAGTVHQMSAGGGAPARARWEARPALRTAEFFRCLYEEVPAGRMTLEDLLAEFSAEVDFSPAQT